MKFLSRCITLVWLLFSCAQALADVPDDLPSRVGRIAYVQGDVGYQSVFGEESVAAVMNWPIASQNIVTTGRNGRAEIRVGSTALRISRETNIEIAELEDDRFLVYLTEGSLHVRVGKEDAEGEFSVRTPHGRVQISGITVLRIDVERDAGAQVTVFQGSAHFDDDESSLTIAAGKRALVRDGEMRLGAAGSVGADAFGAWNRERDRMAMRAASQGYVPPDMTGAEELDRHGIWEQHAEYGTVWYPTAVSADWAPYRAGHWAWIAPWGWTWIDQAAWGYAPSHYGRWAHIDRRWGWVPGPANVRHVWAPALVGWVGGRQWNASFSFGQAPAVGWFPLGPHEPYLHGRHASDGYRSRSNSARFADHPSQIRVAPHGSGVVTAETDSRRYRNRFVPNAVSVLPQERFLNGQRRPMVPVTGVVVAQPGQVRGVEVSSFAPLPGAPAHSSVSSSGPSSVRSRAIGPHDRSHGQAGIVVPSRPAASFGGVSGVTSGRVPEYRPPQGVTGSRGGVSSGAAGQPIRPHSSPPQVNQGVEQGNRFGRFERPAGTLDGFSSGRSPGGVIVQPPSRSGGAALSVPQGSGFSRPSGSPAQGGIITR